jgi:hypothetical protein
MKSIDTGLSLVAVAAMFPGVMTEGAQNNLVGKYDQSLGRSSVRATLNPEMFCEKNIRRAYQAAKEIPWAPDSIYCYCRRVESPFLVIKSLLSCCVDKQAAM